jgi:hypothetical protein
MPQFNVPVNEATVFRTKQRDIIDISACLQDNHAHDRFAASS